MDEKTLKKLEALRQDYCTNLPHKIESIASHWETLCNHWDAKQMEDFHREVHSLSGTAGSYGFTQVSQVSHEIEQHLKLLLDTSQPTPEQLNIVTQLLPKLQAVAMSKQEGMAPLTEAEENPEKLVYYLVADEPSSQQLQEILLEGNYRAQRVADMTELAAAIAKEVPAAIIIDIEMHDGRCDPHSIHNMLSGSKRSIPLFCIASKNDVLTRLKALRAGSSGFILKPLNSPELVRSIDLITGFSVSEPYRILIIEDTPSLAEFYSLVLKQAGMITATINNPLNLMPVLEEFQPDLMLMDLYMPHCNGFELAAIIRQDPNCTRIPIIFLSTEDDRFKQLGALSAGGDDFLTKPISPQHLIAAVRSHAKRAETLSSYIIRDSLTGLLNHTNVLQRLEVELNRAQRSHSPLTFIMIDIDHFKSINDNYGHPTGDKVLRKLSATLTSRLRKIDSVGRYGGEEFAIILPNTDASDANQICNHLREQFQQHEFTANGKTFHVTFSAGISSYPAVTNITDLIVGADQALYQAKNRGRNCVVVPEALSPHPATSGEKPHNIL